ncbi:MAG: cell division protein FtsL [Streptococcaceae bacterium]|nr:cell division protein FtsL [Streptococcaceae bacterium]
MASKRKYFDITTAAKKDSYRIDMSSLRPDVLADRFKKFSAIEKIFYSILVFTALTMAVSLLYVKAKTMEVQGVTANINTDIATKQQQSNQLDQKITDLTSNNQVSAIATKTGMSMNSDNVLKATK